jgi:protein SCO1/2
MRNIKKAGIVAIILAIPAFVFLFLYSQGKNYYDLPIYFATDSAKVDGRYVITAAHTVPSFQLTNQEGRPFSSEELEGNIFVADFFFTSCGGICPKMTSQLTRVQEAFKNNNNVKLVSFTVDPKKDTVETLASYAAEFKINPRKWSLLTGNKDSIYTLAQKGFYLPASQAGTDELPDFIHSERLILVDKKGRIRGYYNGTSKEDVDRLIREIQVLLYQYEHNADQNKQ